MTLYQFKNKTRMFSKSLKTDYSASIKIKTFLQYFIYLIAFILTIPFFMLQIIFGIFQFVCLRLADLFEIINDYFLNNIVNFECNVINANEKELKEIESKTKQNKIEKKDMKNLDN